MLRRRQKGDMPEDRRILHQRSCHRNEQTDPQQSKIAMAQRRYVLSRHQIEMGRLIRAMKCNSRLETRQTITLKIHRIRRERIKPNQISINASHTAEGPEREYCELEVLKCEWNS